MTEKKLYGAFFGPYLYEDDAALDDPDGDFSGMTWDASVSNGLHICAGVRFLDTNQTHHLTLTWNENDTANRTLQFLVAGGNRSITLNENFTIGDGTDITITGVTAARTITLYENFTVADGYDFTLQAIGQANQLTLNEAFTIGDGSAGTLTFGSVCTLTVELASVLNQDLTTDASPAFANLSLGTGELTAGSINRASGSLTLEVGGVAQVTIATTGVTVAPTLILSTCVDAAADVDKFLVLDASNNVDYRTGAEVLSDIGAGVGESTTVTAPLVLTDYDISIPAATNAAAGHATAAHITALEANSAKVTCNFANVQTALAAASGAVAFNSQDLTGVGTIGCGTITTTGNVVLPADGVIGVTDGNPQIVFDNANNWLEITGRVGIGTPDPEMRLSVADNGTDSQCMAQITTYNDQVAWPSEFQFRKSHNDTLGTKTTTLDTESLGALRFQGVDSGGNFDAGAIISAIQDGNAGVRVPTDLKFETYSSTEINPNQLVLHSNGTAALSSLAGTGSRAVVADANGVLSAP